MLAEIGFVVWAETCFKLHSDGNFEPLHSTLPVGDRHLKAAGEQAFSSIWFCTLHLITSMGQKMTKEKKLVREIENIS